MGLRSIGLPEFLILFWGVVFLSVFPAARICRKAGYSAWWGLVFMLPLANIIGMWRLAMADWPTLRRRESERSPEALCDPKL
jgi:hypothetical protein